MLLFPPAKGQGERVRNLLLLRDGKSAPAKQLRLILIKYACFHGLVLLVQLAERSAEMLVQTLAQVWLKQSAARLAYLRQRHQVQDIDQPRTVCGVLGCTGVWNAHLHARSRALT